MGGCGRDSCRSELFFHDGWRWRGGWNAAHSVSRPGRQADIRSENKDDFVKRRGSGFERLKVILVSNPEFVHPWRREGVGEAGRRTVVYSTPSFRRHAQQPSSRDVTIVSNTTASRLILH